MVRTERVFGGVAVVLFLCALWLGQGDATMSASLDFEDTSQPFKMKTGTCPFLSGYPSDSQATDSGSSVLAQARGNCSTQVLSLSDTSYVELGSFDLYTETGEMTFVGWINWSASSPYLFLFQKLNFADSGSTTVQIGFQRVVGTGNPFVPFITMPNSKGSSEPITGKQLLLLVNSTWIHITFAYANGYAKYYINGKFLETVSIPGPLAEPSGSVILGLGAFQLQDDVMFFRNALTDDDVYALYTGSFWEDSPNGCPVLSLPTVSSPPDGLVASSTVLGGFSYQGAGAPYFSTNEVGYEWAETSDVGCTVSEITNATSSYLSARILALPIESLKFSFWTREYYPYRSWQLCSDPSTISLNVSGNIPNISDLAVSSPFTNNISSGIVELFAGETATMKLTVAGFPVPFISWRILQLENVTKAFDNGTLYTEPTLVWNPISSGSSSLALSNTANATTSSSKRGSRVRRIDVPAEDGANTTRNYQAYVQNAVGNQGVNFTVVSYSVVRPSPSPSPSASALPSSSDDSQTIGLAVGLSVGLSALCLLLLLVAAIILFLRFRGPKEFRVVPHRPDFDRLAFGAILAQESPRLDREQTQHAKELEKLLCDESFAVSAVVCDQMKATDSENVSKALTFVFAGNDVAVEAIKFFVTKEVLVSTREGTLFRANSVPTKLFSCYCRIVGLEYLWSVFALPVTELNVMAVRSDGEDRDLGSDHSSSFTTTLMGPVAFEVDPSKMEEASDQSVNTIQLWLVAQKLLSSLMRAIGTLPKELQDILRHVYHEVKEKFNEEAAHKAIGGFLFLRFVCPALMAPQVYGLLKEPPHSTAQRQLILIAKVLQNLANDTLPGKKEGYMERLNMFITTNQEPLKHYYRNLVDGHDGPSGSREVPEEVIVKVTTHMHAHIYPNLDKITSALDASEHAEQSAPLRACIEGMGAPDEDFA